MKFINIANAAPVPEEHAAEEAVHTTASTDAHAAPVEQGVLGSLGIDGSLLIGQLISFGLVVLILWFLILKPLTKKMGERQKIIDESLENAKKVEENLLRSEQTYQQRMDEAKVEANKIIEKAGVEAGHLGVEMKEKAKKEIDTLIEQAKRNLHIEKEEMVAGLKKETANFIIIALEKILSEKVTSEKDKQLIEEMLTKLK